ncbi:MAG: molybdenum cofactor guanylyltransferase [Betaproteobacteria bacterium]|nr:molybdenum cofactor guanylyltransferase [Betaproteobacteria bacterium]
MPRRDTTTTARAAGVTGLVFAGGLGRRMGGADKGLLLLDGRPLIERVLERFRPQVEHLLINANQNEARYAAFGHRVVPDRIGGFAGPLAGLHAGIIACLSLPQPARYLATVPCDSPFLPMDLVARLRQGLEGADAQIAVARTGDQAHPVFMLCRTGVLEDLSAYLEGGGRKMDAWYRRLPFAEIAFDDEAEAFANINTRDELAAFSAREGNA